MKNYFMIDGKKIPMSDETAKSILENSPTYEQVASNLFLNSHCFFISDDGSIKGASSLGKSRILDKNNAKTKDQLESLLALNQLANVAVYLNRGWVPDFYKGDDKFFFYRYDDRLQIDRRRYTLISSVNFKTRELAERAIKILGEDVIEKALTLNYA